MNVDTPFNSEFQSPNEGRAQNNQVTTQSHYRRRDTHIKVYPNHLGGNTQTVFQSSKMDDQHHTPTSESGQEDRESQIPKVKISDANGVETDDRGHLPEDEKEFDPNKKIPEEENYLVDEEGSIVKEPTREADDSYRPGHGTKEYVPPMEKEYLKTDPKENTETDF